MVNRLEITPVALPSPSPTLLARRVAVALSSASRHLVAERRAGRLDRLGVARVIRRTFDDLGGTFTKFGQLIASSPGLFGDDVAAEFRGCLDAGPPIPFGHLRRAIRRDLDRPIEECFATIDPEPLAAASLAVVHRATLLDGRTVAVKVLRPGIRTTLATDLATMRPLADFVARQVAVGVAGTLPGLVRGLADQVSEEVDLTNEARSIIWFRELIEAIDARLIRIPEPVDGLCGSQVLTMELIDGVAVDDDEAIAAWGVDPRPALRECLRAWFAGLLCVGAFHGDIHAGNLLICPDGKMGVLDWGIVGRIDAATGQFMRRLLDGALGDETAWLDVSRHIEAIYGTALREAIGLDETGFSVLMRNYFDPLLSSPIGDVDLRTMLLGFGLDGDGEAERQPGAWGAFNRWRAERRNRRALMDTEAFGGDFDRSTFLLGKQLVYFERYGKRYLPDVPLIDDPDAYRRLLDVIGTIELTEAATPPATTLNAASALIGRQKSVS